MSAPAIETNELSKSYGSVRALRGLTLAVERGEILGFLGPNGAGKTTTIRILLDLIRPTSGVARVAGFDCQAESTEVRRRTGYLPGEVRLYEHLRGSEMLDTVAAIRGLRGHVERSQQLAARLELDLTKHCATYSKGNRQKLGIVLALLGDPQVLLLDEPTSGLDPVLQQEVLRLLRDEAGRGRTVFFSSHIMSEVEQVCERVAVLRSGELVTLAPLDNLLGKSARTVVVRFVGEPPPRDSVAIGGVNELRRDDGHVVYSVDGPMDPFLRAIVPYGISDLRTEQPSLEETLLRFYEKASP